MIHLAKLLPQQTFTNAEINEIAEHMTNPAVAKYLKFQQTELIKGIGNGMPAEGESAESYVRRQATVVGAIGAIEQLLNIEMAKSAASS